MSMPDASQLQQLRSQLQAIDQQLTAIHQQREQFGQYVSEITMSVQTLKGLNEPTLSNNGLFPLPGSVYLKMKVISWEEVMVNVGAGVVIPMKVEEAITYLEKKIENIQSTVNEMDAESQKLQQTAQQIQSILQGNMGISPDPSTQG